MNWQRVGRCVKSATGTVSSPIDTRELARPPGAAAGRKRVEQPELVHHLQRRRVDRVAAEVAQEVGVLLEHDDLDAGAREQQAEHHAGRPAAGDAAGGRDLLVADRAHDRLPRRPGNPSRLVAFRSSW